MAEATKLSEVKKDPIKDGPPPDAATMLKTTDTNQDIYANGVKVEKNATVATMSPEQNQVLIEIVNERNAQDRADGVAMTRSGMSKEKWLELINAQGDFDFVRIAAHAMAAREWQLRNGNN